MAQVIPSDTQQVGDPGHTTVVHNNIADMLGLISSVVAQAAGSPNCSPVPPAAAAVSALQSALTGQTLDDSRDFHPEAYGTNVGDGKLVTDGAMTSAGATLTCATSAPFTLADIGKYVLVQGAGSATTNWTLVTTITGFTDSANVTLGVSASATVSTAWVIFGTDSTAAINAAVQAATAYARAGPMEAVIQFLPKIYMVAGAPVQGDANWGPGNAQIPFPFQPMTSSKLSLVFEGIPDTPLIHYGLNSTPVVAGAALVCCRTDGTANVTYGPASVMGGYTHEQGAGDSVFSNFRPVFQGITVVVPYGSTYSGVDCYGVCGMAVRSLACVAFASPSQMANPSASITAGIRWTFGLRTPTLSNDGNPFIDDYVAMGFGQGLAASQHLSGSRGFTLYNYYGLFGYTDGASVMQLSSRLHYWCCENNWAQVAFDGGSSHCNIDIGTLDVDAGSTWAFYDPSNNGYGQIGFRITTGGAINISGGANLQIKNLQQLSGHVSSPPAVPASTVTYTNVLYRDAAVFIVTPGGVTVSAVTIDGSATGLTLAASSNDMVVVPSGKTIALTYAGGTPTWNWFLL